MVKPIEEAADRRRFLTEESCRPNARSQFVHGQTSQAVEVEEALAAQVPKRQLDVSPGRILGQDGTQNNLQPSSGWPPVLRPEMRVKRAEVFCEDRRPLGFEPSC